MKKLLCALSVLLSSCGAVGSGGVLTTSPMVLAPAKHGGSGIELRYAVPATLRPGEVAVVRLQLSAVRSDDARVELRSQNPAVRLRLAGQPITGAVSLERASVRTLDVEVIAPDGLQHLDVFTMQEGRFSAHSIPLPVGSGAAALKANGAVTTTPSGEKIISLPAK